MLQTCRKHAFYNFALLLCCLFVLAFTAKAEFSPRVIGGKDTDRTWPWIAALVFDEETDIYFGQFCAGSLIHPYWVVTAAHCVDIDVPEDVDVVLGTENLNDPSYTRINVREIVIHPDFFITSLGSDIALLLLENPATGFEVLPVIEDTLLAAPGVDATILGWGRTSTDPEDPDPFPYLLQEAQLPVVSLSTANQPQSYDGEILPNMLPAGFAAGGVDTCGGDSGGPLLVPDASGNKFVLAGITSFGDGCAEQNKYGIYTRVSDFRPWIKSIILPQYAQWEVLYAAYGEGIDSDADGMTNFLEYLLGSDPSIPGSLGLTDATTANISNTIYPALRFRKRVKDTQLEYQIQQSHDLQNWITLDLQTYQVGEALTVSNDIEEISVRGNIPLNSPVPVFFRLAGRLSENYEPGVRSIKFSDFVNSLLFSLDSTDPSRTGQTYYIKDFQLINPPLGETVKVSLSSNDIDTYLQLVDADTAQIISSDHNSGHGTSSFLTFIPQQNINYTIRVSSWNALDLGDFLLIVSAPFNTTPHVFGHTVNGSLSSSDEHNPNLPERKYDDYSLENVTVGYPVKISLTSDTSGFGFDTFLEVYDEFTGIPFAIDDDSGIGQDSSVMFFAPSGMELIIRVTSFTVSERGPYTLETETAPTISPNETRNGSLQNSDETLPFGPSSARYKDDYLISGLSPGQIVTIEMTSTNVDTYIDLVDAHTSKLIDSDDDGGGGTNSSLTFTAEPGITYVFRATSFGNNDFGSYTIRVF